MDNKSVFAKNLKRYMALAGKSRKEVSDAIGVSYYTFTDWVNAKKFPRMDKVELLADYFGIKKSDLIEEKLTLQAEQKNDALADIVIRLRTDNVFLSVVEKLYAQDAEKIAGIDQMLSAFLK